MDKYAKAVIGGLLAFGTSLLTALGDGHITATEWALAGVAALTVAGGVWGYPNAPQEPPK